MTYAVEILPIVDALAALITVPTGWTKDAAGVKPYTYAPNTLYLYPTVQTFPKAGTGRGAVDANFTLEAVAAGASGEDAKRIRDRAVSAALDGVVKLVVNTVRGNPSAEGLWERLRVDQVRYDAIQGTKARCHVITIPGDRVLEGDI